MAGISDGSDLEVEEVLEEVILGEEPLDPLDQVQIRVEPVDVEEEEEDSDEEDEWHDAEFQAHPDPPVFTRRPGPTRQLPPDSRPIDYFSLFWTHDLWATLEMETNRYYRQSQHALGGHTRGWMDVTGLDLRQFLGICLFMGLMRLPSREDYWSGGLFKNVVPTIMSRDRFRQIWRYLHMANNDMDDKTDKLYKIRSLINTLITSFQANYIPNGFFSLDESMVKWKGRLSFRQFMPNKPIRFGIKIWSLCESSTGYMYNFQVYTGKEHGRPEKNLTFRVVADLCSILYHTNARVFFDNFYTGFEIVEHLLRNSVYAAGTVRRNRKGLPPTTMMPKKFNLKKHEYKLAQKGNFLFVAWQDTKTVCFLSNFHSPTELGQVNRRDAQKNRIQIAVPSVIAEYQQHMGGVDRCDQNVGYYMGALKSRKWWRRMFFYLLQVTVFNTYVFAKSCNPDAVAEKYPNQKTFIHELIADLFDTRRVERDQPLHEMPVNENSHFVQKLYAKKKVCRECSLNRPGTSSSSRQTTYGCQTCGVPVHRKCQVEHIGF